ncbi:hypothetical protein AK830_g4186 [Neonectria ditissima]|uniref:Uncharacterized protein n=1 Tax=Neonectria ditissima TaxID=78410 RepID=A0A0N8H7P5_9HYPO|nr:hypothetical protein AK830_g4186 [Neonectria ditissima]
MSTFNRTVISSAYGASYQMDPSTSDLKTLLKHKPQCIVDLVTQLYIRGLVANKE